MYFGRVGAKQDLESVCGGLGLRKKGRFVSDAARRLDPPAATGPEVTVEIVLSMANTEQVSPQDIWTSVTVPTAEIGQRASLCCVSGIYWQCFHQRVKLP